MYRYWNFSGFLCLVKSNLSGRLRGLEGSVGEDADGRWVFKDSRILNRSSRLTKVARSSDGFRDLVPAREDGVSSFDGAAAAAADDDDPASGLRAGEKGLLGGCWLTRSRWADGPGVRLEIVL
jgi:hypothetical protein